MDRQRFEQLWERCGGRLASVALADRFDEVSSRYSESHRHYHTPEHIAHCLQQFDAARSLMDDPNAVELAVWYHDVVYEIGVDDNEALSADLFARHAQGILSAVTIADVRDLIMTTMHLCSVPATSDQAYLVDIDLSSFGLPHGEFLRDSVAVREEFSCIPDQEFYPKQQRFLCELLDREYFCFTAFFRARHEQLARSNICSYLEELQGRGLISAQPQQQI